MKTIYSLKEAYELTRQYPHGSYLHSQGKQYIADAHYAETGKHSNFNWDVLLPWIRVKLGFDPAPLGWDKV